MRNHTHKLTTIKRLHLQTHQRRVTQNKINTIRLNNPQQIQTTRLTQPNKQKPTTQNLTIQPTPNLTKIILHRINPRTSTQLPQHRLLPKTNHPTTITNTTNTPTTHTNTHHTIQNKPTLNRLKQKQNMPRQPKLTPHQARNINTTRRRTQRSLQLSNHISIRKPRLPKSTTLNRLTITRTTKNAPQPIKSHNNLQKNSRKR